MNRRGFTILELIIVITVMGILMIVGVINLSGTMANARDAERRSDAESIAMRLEEFFSSGNGIATNMGRYPSTNEFIGHESSILPDLDKKSLMSPNESSPSLISATDANSQSPPANQYIYQPLFADGSLCVQANTDKCRKFNIYYHIEIPTSDCPAVNGNICKITSKNQ